MAMVIAKLLSNYQVETGLERGWGGAVCRIHGGCPLDGMYHVDRGVAAIADIRHQWYRVRGVGMEGFPLPVIWHWVPWLTWILQWMWRGIWHLPRLQLQWGMPRHGASQRALWWIRRPCKQGLHPHAYVWWPQNLHRLLHEWKEGQAQRIPFKRQMIYEGLSTYHRPLRACYSQYSQHAWREYWHHLLPVQIHLEVSGNRWLGKEKELYRRLHQKSLILHSLSRLSGHPSWGWGRGNTETYRDPPRNKMEGTIPKGLQA